MNIFIFQNRGKMPRGKGTDAKPRGRMTAYAFFVQTCREEHKKKHPDENVIFAEFSKKCAERWKVSVTKPMNHLRLYFNTITHTPTPKRLIGRALIIIIIKKIFMRVVALRALLCVSPDDGV